MTPTAKLRQREKKRARNKIYRANVKRRLARLAEIKAIHNTCSTVPAMAGTHSTPAQDETVAATTMEVDLESEPDDPLSEEKVVSSLRRAAEALEANIEVSSKVIKELDDLKKKSRADQGEVVDTDILKVGELGQSVLSDSTSASAVTLPRGELAVTGALVGSDENPNATHSEPGFPTEEKAHITTPPPSPSSKELSTYFTPIDTALSALAIVSRSQHQSLEQHLEQYRKDFFEQ